MKNTYGKKNWEKLWEKLEQEGNFGIDYVINPYLYPEISDALESLRNAVVLDCGGGTGILGTQFLFGYQRVTPGLRLCKGLENARKNIGLLTTIEGDNNLIKRGKQYLRDVGSPHVHSFLQFHVQKDSQFPYADESIDLVTTRNFLMHISIDDLEYHIGDVARVLKKNHYYIAAFLNPAYELWKYRNIKGKSLKEGEQYSFSHGKTGEHGTFFHYYKTIDTYEEFFKKYFTIEKVHVAKPVDESWKFMYERYFMEDCPMAFVYVLKKK